MANLKLNVFFRVFILLVFLLNILGVFFVMFFHFQHKEEQLDLINSNIKEDILRLKGFYQNYSVNPDSLKNNNIKEFSGNISDFISGDFIIVKIFEKSTKVIYNAPREILDLKQNDLLKKISNRPIEEQSKEQYENENEIKYFSVL